MFVESFLSALCGTVIPALMSYRIYPVVPTNARVFAEEEVVVGGYKFPKDVSKDEFPFLYSTGILAV